MKRLTLQGAIRYDRAWSYFPEQTIGAVRFLPTPITFPEQRGVQGYNDITPRGGLAYDLFGNGNTALKFNIGKYLEAATNQKPVPAPPILIEQENRFPRRRGARAQARRLDFHQRNKAMDLGLLGHQTDENSPEA